MIGIGALLHRLPTPSEHRALAVAVGWAHAFRWETMDAFLKGSLAGAVAVDGSQIVGMGGAVPLYRRRGFSPGDMTGMFRLVEPILGGRLVAGSR